MLVPVVFLIASVAGMGMVGLSLAQLVSTRFQFWPPPNTECWEYWTFRWLFRIMLGGLIVVSGLDFETLEAPAWRHYLSLPLWAAGFGAAFYLTSFLGWRSAFGADEGLKTNGVYRVSRNPIYLVSIIGMIGWGISVASIYASVLLTLWALFYVIAPFVEEPWLERRYGDVYRTYRSKVRRFI